MNTNDDQLIHAQAKLQQEIAATMSDAKKVEGNLAVIAQEAHSLGEAVDGVQSAQKISALKASLDDVV